MYHKMVRAIIFYYHFTTAEIRNIFMTLVDHKNKKETRKMEKNTKKSVS